MRAGFQAAAVAALYIYFSCAPAQAAQAQLPVRVAIVNCADLGFSIEKGEGDLCRQILNQRAREQKTRNSGNSMQGNGNDGAHDPSEFYTDKWGKRIYTPRDLERIRKRNAIKMRQRRS